MVPLPWPQFCLCCILDIHELKSVSEQLVLFVLELNDKTIFSLALSRNKITKDSRL
jgi:hypothetical protein